MYRRLATALLAASALAACAMDNGMSWYPPPGMSPMEANKSRFECETATRQSAASFGYYSRQLDAEQFFSRCLLVHGWSYQPRAAVASR